MIDPSIIEFTGLRKPSAETIVLFADETDGLTPAGLDLDKQSGGALSRALKIADFSGKAKKSIELLIPPQLPYDRVIISGVGKTKDNTPNDWLNFGGVIGARLGTLKGGTVAIVAESANSSGTVSGEEAANLALGMILRSYKFKKYKTKSVNGDDNNGNGGLSKIDVYCSSPNEAASRFDHLRAVGDGVILARDLVNEPANKLGPQEFADAIVGLEQHGLKIEVLGKEHLEELRMGALLGVGQGSDRPTYAVVMRWDGGKKNAKPVAFVGKGVVFDTGGLSLKPAAGMEDMKGDMGGAACVTGLMLALAKRRAAVNAVGIVGLVENMPSGTAQRPGDVITSMSGQTIEVLNTDAEGRLVLADLLTYTQEYIKPKLAITLATLTGAIIVALGKEHAGLFSNDQKLAEKLLKAGQETDEKVWQLPLGAKYDKMLDSPTADMKNIGGRDAGSITAAQFIKRFVSDDLPWAHIDVAGTAMGSPQTDINPSWGSGYGVRLLDRFVEKFYET